MKTETSVRTLERVEQFLSAHAEVIALIAVAGGFLLRLSAARSSYLNPDEAHHYELAARHVHGWKQAIGTAMEVAHPPGFILLLRVLLWFGRSEVMLRMTSVVGGALYPLLVMVWVRRFAGELAGLTALLILTFSPAMINLGSEVRGYALALFCVSLALLLLDRALDRGSVAAMGLFYLALYAAILTEYSVAWAAAAVGVYSLLRLWWPSKPAIANLTNLRAVWVVGQSVALGLYGYLYMAQVSRWSHESRDATAYLRDAFPRPGQHVASFALMGTLQQFGFLLSVHRLESVAAAVFILGLVLLWSKNQRSEAILIALPFGMACLGGILQVFPYGATRQTAILGIFAATGLGQFASSAARNKMLPVLVAAVVLIPVWVMRQPYIPQTIQAKRQRLALMRDSVRFLRTQVPPGSVVLTDSGTDYMLTYYFAASDPPLASEEMPKFFTREAGGLRFLVGPEFQFASDSTLRAEADQVRGAYPYRGPLWVAAGGFFINVTDPDAKWDADSAAIAVFKTE